MKTYPPIQRSTGQQFREIPNAYIFDKIDGSNLRFEWSKKAGWNKFGTRKRLFDETDEVFGGAVLLFLHTIADPMEQIARKQRWDNITAYCEYWGRNSFAGIHQKEDHILTLFDVNVYKKGILGPKEFLKLFDNQPIAIPRFLGIHNWTRGFVENVRQDKLEGVTFEGVVGKAGEGHKLVMAKAKTQKWIDKVKALYPENAESIINS